MPSDDRSPDTDERFMRLALQLARRACGETSPNPMVGAVLVKGEQIIGRGWHRRAGDAHAEIEALRDAQAKGYDPTGATLYISLEPCSTHGRTPPCTESILAARIKRVVVAATDPNPRHAGRGYRILAQGGVKVDHGILATEARRLNEAFEHWIVHGTPFVTVKSAMTLDGKIATASGESKWITSERARAWAMRLRQEADAVLVGVNTVLADDPSLTWRGRNPRARQNRASNKTLRRIVLDSKARTPCGAKVVSDDWAERTTIVVTRAAPQTRVARLAARTHVLKAPALKGRVNLTWLLSELGRQNVTHLLVEGGGEVNAAFLFGRFAHRIAFFYAPRILGGFEARRAVAGIGAARWPECLELDQVEWRRLGPDLLLTARIARTQARGTI